jgi:hypothetical protein
LAQRVGHRISFLSSTVIVRNGGRAEQLAPIATPRRHRHPAAGGLYFCQASGAFHKSWTLERLAFEPGGVSDALSTVRHAFAIPAATLEDT